MTDESELTEMQAEHDSDYRLTVFADYPPPFYPQKNGGYHPAEGTPNVPAKSPVYVSRAPESTMNIPPPSYNQALPQGPAVGPSGDVRLHVASAIVYEPAPRIMECPHCNITTRSHLRKEFGTRVHGLAFVMCVSILCIPCVWLPYCLESMKDANHYCGSCGKLIGTEIPYVPQHCNNQSR